jgi:hypothetical protein
VVVEGRSNEELRVVNIRATDVQRAAPLSGTLFYMPPQEAAASIGMMLNLDSPAPVMRSLAGFDEWGAKPGRPYFEENSIRLPDRAQDTLVIRITAVKKAVRFRLAIDYVKGGSDKSMVIDDHGEPFGITPLHCVGRGLASYRRAYGYGSDLALTPLEHPEAIEVTGVRTSRPRRGQEVRC